MFNSIIKIFKKPVSTIDAWHAITNGDVDQLRIVLKTYVPFKRDNGDTFIHNVSNCTEYDNVYRILKYLISIGYDPLTINNDHNTILSLLNFGMINPEVCVQIADLILAGNYKFKTKQYNESIYLTLLLIHPCIGANKKYVDRLFAELPNHTDIITARLLNILPNYVPAITHDTLIMEIKARIMRGRAVNMFNYCTYFRDIGIKLVIDCILNGQSDQLTDDNIDCVIFQKWNENPNIVWQCIYRFYKTLNRNSLSAFQVKKLNELRAESQEYSKLLKSLDD